MHIIGTKTYVEHHCTTAINYADTLISRLKETEPKEEKHQWSIEQAKPGDILSATFKVDEKGGIWEKIIIFTNLNDNFVEGYGITLYNGELRFADGDVPTYSKTMPYTFTPATIEQKSTLFRIMCEHNTYWDAADGKVYRVKTSEPINN